MGSSKSLAWPTTPSRAWLLPAASHCPGPSAHTGLSGSFMATEPVHFSACITPPPLRFPASSLSRISSPFSSSSSTASLPAFHHQASPSCEMLLEQHVLPFHNSYPCCKFTFSWIILSFVFLSSPGLIGFTRTMTMSIFVHHCLVELCVMHYKRLKHVCWTEKEWVKTRFFSSVSGLVSPSKL